MAVRHGFHRSKELQLTASSSFQGGKRGWRLSSVINRQWYDQSCWCNETSTTIPQWLGRQLLGCEHLEVLGLPRLCISYLVCVSVLFVFLSCIPYSKLVNVNKVFPWVWWAVLANYWTWGGNGGKPRFLADQPKVQVTIWTCDWHWRWESVLSDYVLNLWDLRNSRKLASELNCTAGHPISVRRAGELAGKGKALSFRYYVMNIKLSYNERNKTVPSFLPLSLRLNEVIWTCVSCHLTFTYGLILHSWKTIENLV